MSGYSVSLVDLEQAVDHADQVGRNISSALTTLEGDVKGHLASWTGDAQAAYNAAKAQWDQISQQMPATLSAARSTLEAIAEQYDNAERSAISTFFNGAS